MRKQLSRLLCIVLLVNVLLANSSLAHGQKEVHSGPLLANEAITLPHTEYDPYNQNSYPTLPPSFTEPTVSRAKANLQKPAGVDLDVVYITRTPKYQRYEVEYANGRPYLKPGTENLKRWPAYGELVTFSAHIINKGTVPSGAFTYSWFIDGVQVKTGISASFNQIGRAHV